MFHTLMAVWVTIAAPVQTSDTTIRVEEGMRLHLRNEAGEIRVTTWERDEVRVVLNRARGVRIDVERSGSVLRIRPALDLEFRDEFRTRGRRGRFDDDEVVDFALTVPAYLDLELYGVETDISVVGMNANVTAETVEGTVLVRGGNGLVVVHSVEEEVRVERVRGRVRASSTDGDVWIRDVVGEVTAESIDGNIELDGVDSRQVTAQTVDGDVVFDGPIHDDGRYHLSTHDGDVSASIPAGTNATVMVASFDGDFETSFSVVLRGLRGRRFHFTLGDGSARIELESFDGDVYLRRRR